MICFKHFNFRKPKKTGTIVVSDISAKKDREEMSTDDVNQSKAAKPKEMIIKKNKVNPLTTDPTSQIKDVPSKPDDKIKDHAKTKLTKRVTNKGDKNAMEEQSTEAAEQLKPLSSDSGNLINGELLDTNDHKEDNSQTAGEKSVLENSFEQPKETVSGLPSHPKSDMKVISTDSDLQNEDISNRIVELNSGEHENTLDTTEKSSKHLEELTDHEEQMDVNILGSENQTGDTAGNSAIMKTDENNEF